MAIISTVGILFGITSIIDMVYGEERLYSEIMDKLHPVTKDDIYNSLNFKIPEIYLSEVDFRNYIHDNHFIEQFDEDSILIKLWDNYLNNDDFQNSKNIYIYLSLKNINDSLKNYLLNKTLLLSNDKFKTLSILNQYFVSKADYNGLCLVDSLLKDWKWAHVSWIGGMESAEYNQRDSLFVECLYYKIRYLEHFNNSFKDSLSLCAFNLAERAIYPSTRYYGSYSGITRYFLERKAYYAYQLHDAEADKYADTYLDRSARFGLLSSEPNYSVIRDKGGNVENYYNYFFTDPLFHLYNACLKNKNYKKAKKILEIISSKTSDVDFNPDNPYFLLSDSIIVQNQSIDTSFVIKYAKYDLASIGENARIRYLLGESDYEKWLIGVYLTGASYLSPTEYLLNTLDSYLFTDNNKFDDFAQYITLNYNNPDPRWVYNTALFVKSNSMSIRSDIYRFIKQNVDSLLIFRVDSLNRKNVFSNIYNDTIKNDTMVQNMLEQKLSHNIKENLPTFYMSYKDVLSRLLPNECVVEIVRVPSLDFAECRYKAIVLRYDWKSPIVVDLGVESRLKDIISEDQFYSLNNSCLYSILWEPIEKYVNTRDVIYYSPDGILNVINISAIGTNSGNRISDIYDIRQCVSSKSIIDYKPVNELENIVLFGGLIYDSNTPQMDTLVYNGGHAYRSNVSTSTLSHIQFLDGAEEEVSTISYYANQNNIPNTLLTGINGTEYNFKSLSNKAISILHLSTHGFYFKDEEAEKISFFDRMNHVYSPLERCGLILSGGQNAWSGALIPKNQEDGILLGSEIARLNLSDTYLVVLSTCNSGSGDISYEGVQGLQKAFKNAGVKYMLVTLTRVDDKATCLLMTNFYKYLFEGFDIRDSFEKAVYVLKMNPQYSNPAYWAPFILIE